MHTVKSSHYSPLTHKYHILWQVFNKTFLLIRSEIKVKCMHSHRNQTASHQKRKNNRFHVAASFVSRATSPHWSLDIRQKLMPKCLATSIMLHCFHLLAQTLKSSVLHSVPLHSASIRGIPCLLIHTIRIGLHLLRPLHNSKLFKYDQFVLQESAV